MIRIGKVVRIPGCVEADMKDYDHFGSTPRAKKTKEKMTQEMRMGLINGLNGASLRMLERSISPYGVARGVADTSTLRDLDP